MKADQIDLAYHLLTERQRLLATLEKKTCGLNGCGIFAADVQMVQAIEPSYRAEIERRIAALNEKLAGMGVDINSPVSWLS